MVVEVFYEVCFDGATSVVNIALPKMRRGGEGNKGLGLNIFHYDVSYNLRSWGPMVDLRTCVRLCICAIEVPAVL